MPKKIKTFKSFKPHRYLSNKKYKQRKGTQFGGGLLYPDERESGHLYKELCANCKKPMGEHYGTGSSVMCPDQH